MLMSFLGALASYVSIIVFGQILGLVRKSE